MLTKYEYLVLALLPTIAYTEIKIYIKTKPNGSADISVSGQDISVITDKERDLFKIEDEALKWASNKFIGKSCSNVFLKPPTPWGDVYKKYNWNVVKTTIKPIAAEVINTDSKTVALGDKEFINNDLSNVTQKMSIVQDVLEKVKHKWTAGDKLGVGRNLHYDIKFGDHSLGGSQALAYTVPWGEADTKSRVVTIGNRATAMALIPPGGKIKATLLAIYHTLEIGLNYHASAGGRVFCNFDGGYGGHKFYALPLNELQYAAHIPAALFANETIIINYYTDVRIEVSNGGDTPEDKKKH